MGSGQLAAARHRSLLLLLAVAAPELVDLAAARGLAELCGVRHESPQAILFEAGVPVWHASHDAITAEALAAAWAPRC